MSHEEIATAIGISRNTLEKHFEFELSQGALQRRLEVLRAMHTAAKKGNVSAQKAYLSTTVASAVPPLPAPDPDVPTPEKVEPLGKKAQADLDAKSAATGTSWETLLTPTGPVQ